MKHGGLSAAHHSALHGTLLAHNYYESDSFGKVSMWAAASVPGSFFLQPQ